MWPSRKLELLTPLIEGLCEERGIPVPEPTGVDEMWAQFRALVNTRPPMPASPQWLALQDQFLSELIAGDGVVSIDEAEVAPLHPNIRLWQGDITRLAADAIVNAANSRMLGCWECDSYFRGRPVAFGVRPAHGGAGPRGADGQSEDYGRI